MSTLWRGYPHPNVFVPPEEVAETVAVERGAGGSEGWEGLEEKLYFGRRVLFDRATWERWAYSRSRSDWGTVFGICSGSGGLRDRGVGEGGSAGGG